MVDRIDKERMAANYGFAVAFFQSNDELWHLFNRAVKQTWTADMFKARLRGTDWFKHHSAAVRSSIMQQTSDPASYEASVDKLFAHVKNVWGATFGTADMDTRDLRSWAETAHRLGWSEEELMDRMTKGLNFRKLLRSDNIGGTAGEIDGQLGALISAYGVDLGPQWRANQVAKIVRGDDRIEAIQARVQELAMREYKAFADDIAGGRTVQDIAEPYIQKMASLLEVNPADINLKNRLVQKALKQRTPDGKPAAMDFTDFEDEVRKDHRWQYTDNAREQMASVVATLAQSFGVLA